MVTEPPPEPVAMPARSPWALWGAALLAWGVAIFLALLFAAQQGPVESSAGLERLAWAFFVLGLLWIALSGWRSVERGWRLRSPTSFAARAWVGDVLIDLSLGAAMFTALVRGEQSRLLAAGLDRIVSAIVTVALISAVLWLIELAVLRYAERPAAEPAERRVRWVRLLIATCLLVLAAAIEFSGW